MDYDLQLVIVYQTYVLYIPNKTWFTTDFVLIKDINLKCSRNLVNKTMYGWNLITTAVEVDLPTCSLLLIFLCNRVSN